MNNNWVLETHGEAPFLMGQDFDDHGYGADHPISIGDEIMVEDEEHPQWGIVVGIIRNVYGAPACYKVVRTEDENDTVGVFDYIHPRQVTLSEPCGTAAWSLARVGYQWLEDEDEESSWCGRFYNSTTGDVIFW